LEKFFDFIGLEGIYIEEKGMQAQINYDCISSIEEHLEDIQRSKELFSDDQAV
jgi:hypothetical protein